MLNYLSFEKIQEHPLKLQLVYKNLVTTLVVADDFTLAEIKEILDGEEIKHDLFHFESSFEFQKYLKKYEDSVDRYVKSIKL